MSDDHKTIKFKSSDAALDYAQKYFQNHRIKAKTAFTGVIRKTKEIEAGTIYMVEINVLTGMVFKKSIREMVIGIIHPELHEPVSQGDLVNWGYDRSEEGAHIGFILNKFSLELSKESGSFNIIQ